MIPVQEIRENDAAGIEESVGFSVKAKNFAVLFNILRNQMYKDPILAVIREYATNAIDAHVAVGKADEPVCVSLPSLLDCFLKIRDFGAGLNDTEVKEIYASYGESTKRNTNTATGMLGIGCKSGFAYNDSFIVNSYKDGTITAWNAFIDPSGEGQMAKMFSGETTEANGIEVVIPVKQNDISKFHDKALHLFSFFRVVPTLLNVQQHTIDRLTQLRDRKPIYKGGDWFYIGGKSQSYAVMGNIPYPIEPDVFSNDMSAEMKGIVEAGIILNFDIGELNFAASREALQYDDLTKKRIIAKLASMNTHLVDELSKGFQTCKSLWEAKALYREVFHTSGSLFAFAYLLKSKVEFKGKKITNDWFDAPTNFTQYHFYKEQDRWGSSLGKMKRSDSFQQMTADKSNIVVINDKDIINGVQNRVVGLIEGANKIRNVYILKFDSDVTYQQWLTDSGYDGPLVKLSDLLKEPMSKYYPNVTAGGNGFQNPKHVSKEFEFDVNGADSKTRSEAWKPITVDPDNDEGVYVVIERFNLLDKGNNTTRNYRLRDTINVLKSAGIDVPRIYGFKQASADRAASNPDMVRFWEWAELTVEAELKKREDAEQALVDERELDDEVGNIIPCLDDVFVSMNTEKPWSSDPDCIISKFCDAYTKSRAHGKETEIRQFRALMSLCPKFVISKKPTINLLAEAKKIAARYPLFMLTLRQGGNNLKYNDKHADAMRDYVMMVDLLTP